LAVLRQLFSWSLPAGAAKNFALAVFTGEQIKRKGGAPGRIGAGRQSTGVSRRLFLHCAHGTILTGGDWSCGGVARLLLPACGSKYETGGGKSAFLPSFLIAQRRDRSPTERPPAYVCPRKAGEDRGQTRATHATNPIVRFVFAQ
jgi:hypothetical protein